MNPDILAKYAQNRLVVTRQVKFIADARTSRSTWSLLS